MPKYAYMISVRAPDDQHAQKFVNALYRWAAMFPMYELDEIIFGQVEDDHTFLDEDDEGVEIVEIGPNDFPEGDPVGPLMHDLQNIIDNAPSTDDPEKD